MATSRFTSTFFAARALDPDERLTVTMAGIISGAMPTAIASENSSASMSGRRQRHVDDEDERRQHRCHPEQEPREARQAHLESRLALLLGQTSRDLPEGGAGPGPDHHAEGRPLVHDRPHEGTSRLVLCLAARDADATDLATGIDSPVRMPSSHSQLVDAEQAEVGRNERADAERHHVARHEVCDGDPARLAVPPDLGLLSDLGPERGHGHLRPVLVEEARDRR